MTSIRNIRMFASRALLRKLKSRLDIRRSAIVGRLNSDEHIGALYVPLLKLLDPTSEAGL